MFLLENAGYEWCLKSPCRVYDTQIRRRVLRTQSHLEQHPAKEFGEIWILIVPGLTFPVPVKTTERYEFTKVETALWRTVLLTCCCFQQKTTPFTTGYRNEQNGQIRSIRHHTEMQDPTPEHGEGTVTKVVTW